MLTLTKPIVHDLYCGLGGWSEGFLAEGYECIGYDIQKHDYGTGTYPGELVIQDILTMHGSRCKDAAVIVASPPCQKYSYMAMPWKLAKKQIAWYKESPERVEELNAMFNACFRIQREASAAAEHYIPMIVENVCGAQKWVGRAKWHFGSFYLWGDVPALMPVSFKMRKSQHVPLFETPSGTGKTSWFFGNSKHEGRNYGIGEKGIPHKPAGHWTNPDENGTKQGGDWFGANCKSSMSRLYGSKSKARARARASAEIAKIPFPLSQHIAQCFLPVNAC